MKDVNDKSWFMFVRSILDLYNLPSIFTDTPSKNEWKRTMNKAINEAIVKSGWEWDIRSETSLKYINTDTLKVGKCHHVWSTVRGSIHEDHDSRRAQLKCRLLTGTYILQGNRAAFNQYQVDPTCRLCSVSPETRQHFVSECSFLNPERSAFIEKLLENPALQHIPSSQFQNPELVMQLTLDASVVLDKEKVDKDSWGLLELQTREFIHKIHHKRLSELKRLAVF